jgi:DNA polymerase-3 subunit epsilon
MSFLDRLRGNKKSSDIAVIDVETTGLNPYRHDRIVELAALVIGHEGTVLREFVSLINPERDIGPTHIHGLSARDVLAAPRFGELAGALLDVLDGCVALAGHNIRFDYSFLAAEFDRLGYGLPDAPTLCTMRLAGGGRLSAFCVAHGIAFEGQAHSAQYDARATARLLAVLLNRDPRLTREVSHWLPIAWPSIPKSSAMLLTRDGSRQRQTTPPDYLQQLLTRVQPVHTTDNQDSAILEYIALLDQVLENRHISTEEGQALIEFATRWGVPAHQIPKIHREYLLRLATAALADGVVTDAERRDLQQVAWLLGIDSLDEVMEAATHELQAIPTRPSATGRALTLEELAGKRVSFTGEFMCRLAGQAITRTMAVEIATSHGMTVADSVTKKLDLLVVADPLTQSLKAKKARQYRIRIIHEFLFWRALGLKTE